MSITYNKLQRNPDERSSDANASAAPDTKKLAAEKRKRAKETVPPGEALATPKKQPQDLRRNAKPKPAPTPPPAPDPTLAAELQRLRIREQSLADDAHNTTQLLEAAQHELERMQKALAEARAGQAEPRAAAHAQATAELQSARDETDRVHNELARVRAELSVEREARRRREDELVQNLRTSTERLDAATQTINRQHQDREKQQQALAALETAALQRERALRERLATRDQAAAALWYVRLDDGAILGPVEEQEVRDWSAQCRLGPDHELSHDREQWVRARDVAALQMEWMVRLVDGRAYGPLNLFAIPHLLADGSLDPDSPVESTRTGFACTARDAGIPEILALRRDQAHLKKELAALRAELNAERRSLPANAAVPPPPAPPKSVRAQILSRGTLRRG